MICHFSIFSRRIWFISLIRTVWLKNKKRSLKSLQDPKNTSFKILIYFLENLKNVIQLIFMVRRFRIYTENCFGHVSKKSLLRTLLPKNERKY